MRARSDQVTGGHLQEAIAELIRVDAVQAAAERTERARVQRLIRLTDSMIAELELENLKGVSHVSSAWHPRLALLCAGLPIDLRRRLGSLETPTQVLDLIFEVQELLFGLKRSRWVDLRSANSARWRMWGRPPTVQVAVMRRPGVHRVPVRVA
jgi:hypothetical protein